MYVIKNWLPAEQQHSRGSMTLAAKQCSGLADPSTDVQREETPSCSAEATPHEPDVGVATVEVQLQPQAVPTIPATRYHPGDLWTAPVRSQEQSAILF